MGGVILNPNFGTSVKGRAEDLWKIIEIMQVIGKDARISNEVSRYHQNSEILNSWYNTQLGEGMDTSTILCALMTMTFSLDIMIDEEALNQKNKLTCQFQFVGSVNCRQNSKKTILKIQF